MSKNKILLISVILSMCLLGGCGKEAEIVEPEAITTETVVEEEPAVENETEEAVAEETTEETAEEVIIEDPNTDLSNEEWVESLNFEKPTFLIFNDATGKRKVLEDSQEYKMSETDVLAFKGPLNWELTNMATSISFDTEVKYKCMIMRLSYDELEENTEVIAEFKDPSGDNVTITIYLSK